MSKGQVPKAPFTFLSSHFFTFPLFLSAAPPNTSCTLVPLYFLACKSKTIQSRVTPIMMMLMTIGKSNCETRQCSNSRHKANRFPAVIYSKALFCFFVAVHLVWKVTYCAKNLTWQGKKMREWLEGSLAQHHTQGSVSWQDVNRSWSSSW